MEHLKKYIFFVLMCLLCFEAKSETRWWIPKLIHYDGCVNIGVPDTLLLRVENADARLRYRWQIPDTWEPIGDTNRGELRVITHETKDTTHIYGVKFADRENWRYDTVQVKGADTTLYIWRRGGLVFCSFC